MGQFEEIMDAMEPLYGQYSHAQIVFNNTTPRSDIILKMSDYSIWDILFHQDPEKNLAVYFFFDRTPDFLLTLEGLDLSGFQVFSGPNVFRYLGIQYPSNHGCFLQDLYTMAKIISENFDKFEKSAADENIKKTFFSLKAMSGNNEKGMREIIKPVYNLIR